MLRVIYGSSFDRCLGLYQVDEAERKRLKNLKKKAAQKKKKAAAAAAAGEADRIAGAPAAASVGA